MNIEMVLYFIDFIEKLGFVDRSVFALSSLAILIIILISFCGKMEIHECIDSDSEYNKNRKNKLNNQLTVVKSCFKPAIIIACISFFIFISLPSQKTMYMMLASNAAKKSEIPEKVLKAIEMKLDEYIDEVKDKVKK